MRHSNIYVMTMYIVRYFPISRREPHAYYVYLTTCFPISRREPLSVSRLPRYYRFLQPVLQLNLHIIDVLWLLNNLEIIDGSLKKWNFWRILYWFWRKINYLLLCFKIPCLYDYASAWSEIYGAKFNFRHGRCAKRIIIRT